MDLENSLLTNSFPFLRFWTDKAELQCFANNLTNIEFYLWQKNKTTRGSREQDRHRNCKMFYFQNPGLWYGDRIGLWHDWDVKQFFRKHRIYISGSFTDATIPYGH